MYKYLSITRNEQEMMVMMRSLPVSTIVFDQNGKIIDINQPALNFFKIKSIEDYAIKKWEVLNNRNLILSIIKELKCGKVVIEKNQLLKCPDCNVKDIKFCASMLSGQKTVFIFQFMIVSNSKVSFEELLSHTVHQPNQNLGIIPKGNREILQMFEDRSIKRAIFKRYLNEEVILAISRKYPTLSNREVIICGLVSLNMSTVEMAIVTNKRVSNVHSIIFKLRKKFSINSRRELYLKLIAENSRI